MQHTIGMQNTFIVRTGGEVDIRITPSDWNSDASRFSPSNSDELMEMLLTIDHTKPKKINIGYFPYGRADRKIFHPGLQDEEPNGCVTMCRLLRSLAPDAKITVTDAHNPRVLEAFDIENRYPRLMLTNPWKDHDFVVVSPDAGASDRAKHYSYGGTKNHSILFCQKVRDMSGKPSVFVPKDVSLRNKTCVIFDDIIDGGRTFTNLARSLKEADAGNIILHATHGIFSNGFDLGPDIHHIYVTDSCPGARAAREQKIENITVKTWYA